MGHSIDLNHVAAHPIGELPAYADLAEFQPRRGSGEAFFASYRFVPQSKYCCAIFVRLQRLTTHSRSCDRRKPEAQARQLCAPFGAKETQPLSQTGSTLTRTSLSPFARCTLGLNRHSPAILIKIFYATTACMTQGFTFRKY